MNLLNRGTDYAIRAICFMAKNNQGKTSVRDLVKELIIPRPFLRKILQILNKKGLLYSYKGQGGGFALAKPPNKIFVVDLIEIFQGPMKLNECFFKKMSCPNTHGCALKRKIDSIERYVIRELKSITIGSLIKGKVNDEL